MPSLIRTSVVSAVVAAAVVFAIAACSARAAAAGPESVGRLQIRTALFVTGDGDTPTPTPTSTDPPAPVQNHTLAAEKCGKSKGREAWEVGSLQCQVMDTGAIVGIHRGKAAVKYSGTAVQKELNYLDDNWYTQGDRRYTYLPNEDCANFVSQALRARGWATTSSWKPGSTDWISSTHLRKWILDHHKSVKELKGVAAFSKVKVGDIAQFDWKNKGIRNHTAIVTAVQVMADGSYNVWVGEHTDPYEYRNVLDVITVTHPGATVYFLSL